MPTIRVRLQYPCSLVYAGTKCFPTPYIGLPALTLSTGRLVHTHKQQAWYTTADSQHLRPGEKRRCIDKHHWKTSAAHQVGYLRCGTP